MNTKSAITGVCAAACALLATAGEKLYNGIVLPEEWPPKIDIGDKNPIRAPYLEKDGIPDPIVIDTGRQLFVDDFLVESTNGVFRAFFKPVKYVDNPVIWPETKAELALNTKLGDKPIPEEVGMKKDWDPMYKTAPGVACSGGGLWWDPSRKRFRLWYMSGWSGRISLAESEDGLHWTRPPVGENGTNIVIPKQRADTFSVWPGYDTDAPFSNWRICISPGGNPTRSAEYTSKDGIHWDFLKKTGEHGDCTTLIYNPFRGKWIWSLRAAWRARSRIYREHSSFEEGADWNFPASGGMRKKSTGADPLAGDIAKQGSENCYIWLACDNKDLPRTVDGSSVRSNAQLYNVDAVPYESVMVGFFKILCGRDNIESARAGMPKTTHVQFAFSRDGFHYTRNGDRKPDIPDSDWGSGAWDSGYVGSISSGFVIKDEQLWIYYVGVRGDRSKNDPPRCMLANGMHWNFSIGIAKLRRDGFAGMVSDGEGDFTTRPVVFSGSRLFVNADARLGSLSAEILDADGKPFPGYAAADCEGLVRENSTKREIKWKGGDLSKFAGKKVRFRFLEHTSTLYSFWVSKKPTGESGGWLAAGGPDYKGLKDE